MPLPASPILAEAPPIWGLPAEYLQAMGIALAALLAVALAGSVLRRRPDLPSRTLRFVSGAPQDGALASCGECGFDVASVAEPKCPECGADLRRVGIVTPRTALRRPRVLPLLVWTVMMWLAWIALPMIVDPLFARLEQGYSWTYKRTYGGVTSTAETELILTWSGWSVNAVRKHPGIPPDRIRFRVRSGDRASTLDAEVVGGRLVAASDGSPLTQETVESGAVRLDSGFHPSDRGRLASIMHNRATQAALTKRPGVGLRFPPSPGTPTPNITIFPRGGWFSSRTTPAFLGVVRHLLVGILWSIGAWRIATGRPLLPRREKAA